MDQKQRLEELEQRLLQLLQQQNQFVEQIRGLKSSIDELKATEAPTKADSPTDPVPPAPSIPAVESPTQTPGASNSPPPPPVEEKIVFEAPTGASKKDRAQRRSNLEKFIGENLINKIGIVILVIGVAFGVKYSIDNELVTPLMRVISGYIAGIALIGIAYRLKEKYHAYSAVLLGGGVALMYFVTFSAYAFYDLIPQTMAFILMVLFTGFAVLASLVYNLQLIAVIGMVGAYAVPILLSDGSGRIGVMLSYISVINLGLLYLSLKKYWKIVFYSSFILSWGIYLSWHASSYTQADHFGLSLIFATIFFATFYITNMAYKLINNEEFEITDVVLIIVNAAIYYAIGYGVIDGNVHTKNLIGLFTFANAIAHFIPAYLTYQKKLADKRLFFLVAGLVLTFLTLTFPVQFDGEWVSIFWVLEAAVLFTIGRQMKVKGYEMMAYPLMTLAFFSLLHDWGEGYQLRYHNTEFDAFTPFLHLTFLTNLIYIAAFGWIIRVARNTTDPNQKIEHFIPMVRTYMAPVIFILITYFTFFNEISHIFSQWYQDNIIVLETDGNSYNNYFFDRSINMYSQMSLILYTILFAIGFSFLNITKLKHKTTAWVNYIFNNFTTLLTLVAGLFIVSELREMYLDPPHPEYYNISAMAILIRYIGLASLAALVYTNRKLLQANILPVELNKANTIAIHGIILWTLSSEMIHWMDMADVDGQYKLGLSILWGAYSLLMVVIGMQKKLPFLRISGMVLFGITLIKVFIYDLAHLSTLHKTIVMIVLGALLLVMSFLYNKYKQSLFEDEENEISGDQPGASE